MSGEVETGSPISPSLSLPRLRGREREGLRLARDPQISLRNLRKLDCDRTQNRGPPRIKSGAGFLLVARYARGGQRT